MNFLYTLSNICVPFALMLFETVKRDNEGLKPSYGKWLALFLLTFIFNGLSIFSRWWITLFDLAVKCSLYFLPQFINQKIQHQISSLHLQSYIQNARNLLVNIVFWAEQKSIWIVLRKLRPEEAQQFKQSLKNSLTKQHENSTIAITAVPKLLESTGINCTIISEAAVEQTLIKREIETKKGDIEKRLSPDSSRRSDSSSKPKKDFQIALEKEQFKSFKQYENKTNKPEGQSTNALGNNLRDSFHQLRQSSKIIASDNEEEEALNKDKGNTRFSRQSDDKNASRKKSRSKPKQNPRRKQNELLQQTSKLSDQKKEEKKPMKKETKKQAKKEVEKKENKDTSKKTQEKQSTLKRRHTDISDIKDAIQSRERSLSPESKEQAEMLEKLDVSASEYSDMFDEDREDDLPDDPKGETKLVCKVQAIVQIGSAPTSKLQIYNLQLYSNGDLRIMSLYGRQFQKHKLVSVTKSQNNYYTLYLSDGPVNSRKIKFRGQHQPFMKYLQQI